MKCSSVEGGREGGGGYPQSSVAAETDRPPERGSAEGAGVGISGPLRPEGVLQSPAQLSQFRKWMVLLSSWPRGSPLSWQAASYEPPTVPCLVLLFRLASLTRAWKTGDDGSCNLAPIGKRERPSPPPPPRPTPSPALDFRLLWPQQLKCSPLSLSIRYSPLWYFQLFCRLRFFLLTWLLSSSASLRLHSCLLASPCQSSP